MKIDKGVQKPFFSTSLMLLRFNIYLLLFLSFFLSFFLLSNQRKVELTRFNNSIDNQEEQQEAEAEGEEKRMAMMIGGRFNYGLTIFLILLGHFFCSGSKLRIKDHSHEEKQLHFTTSISTTSISTTQKDITTPITTVPTITPTTPTSSTPIMNPTSTPDSTSPITTTPSSTTTTSSTSASWCVASQSASQMALQVALDYACGYGTDCSEIQLGRSCYNPNTVRDHASYAFNTYYQKNPVPNSCNFGGTAVITSTDPSTGTCQFPSTSTSSSVLNTTNSSGSTVFGAVVPSGPSTSAAASTANLHCLRNLFTMMCLMVVLIT